MFDYNKWQEIFHVLQQNKLRTALTGFGVMWGIFMLIIMLASGKGLQNAALGDLGEFATNSAFIWTQSTTKPYKGFQRGRYWNFTNEDIKNLKQRVPEIGVIAPRLNAWGGSGANNVVRGLRTGSFNINGDAPEYRLIDPCKMTSGRFINDSDIEVKRKVVVIGQRVREVLFEKDEEPVGQYIRIQGVYFMVVGVFESTNGVNIGGDKKETVYMPYTTLQKTYNYGNVVHYFSVTGKDGVPVSQVEEKCMKLLAEWHSVDPTDLRAFGHFNLEEQFNRMSMLFMGIQMLIWIVGTGSLIAGAIGVSNIMLITVNERTREIGIQRAIGATPIKVISQIVTESVFLTSMAGAIGLVGGVWLVEIVGSILANSGDDSMIFKNPSVDFSIAITALIILVAAGTLAGLIPAKRAVSIKPIDALRHE